MTEFEKIKREIIEKYVRKGNQLGVKCDEDYMNDLKIDVAWLLGIEEDSDEWYELMDI